MNYVWPTFLALLVFQSQGKYYKQYKKHQIVMRCISGLSILSQLFQQIHEECSNIHLLMHVGIIWVSYSHDDDFHLLKFIMLLELRSQRSASAVPLYVVKKYSCLHYWVDKWTFE